MKFCSEVCCILTHFYSNLGLRGGKYSGLTNAEISKKYRKSMTEAKKEKERIRKQRWRQNLKENPAKYKKYLENERLQKNYSNLMKFSSFIIIKQPNTRSIGYKSIRRSIKGNHKTSFTKWIGFLNQTIPEPKFEKGSRSSAAKPKKRSRDYSKFGIQVPNTKKDARKSWSPQKITFRREKGLDDRIP